MSACHGPGTAACRTQGQSELSIPRTDGSKTKRRRWRPRDQTNHIPWIAEEMPGPRSCRSLAVRHREDQGVTDCKGCCSPGVLGPHGDRATVAASGAELARGASRRSTNPLGAGGNEQSDQSEGRDQALPGHERFHWASHLNRLDPETSGHVPARIPAIRSGSTFHVGAELRSKDDVLGWACVVSWTHKPCGCHGPVGG